MNFKSSPKIEVYKWYQLLDSKSAGPEIEVGFSTRIRFSYGSNLFVLDSFLLSLAASNVASTYLLTTKWEIFAKLEFYLTRSDGGAKRKEA